MNWNHNRKPPASREESMRLALKRSGAGCLHIDVTILVPGELVRCNQCDRMLTNYGHHTIN